MTDKLTILYIFLFSFFLIICRVLYLREDISELIGEIQLEQLPLGNETISIIIPCGYFSRGGIYALRVEYKYENLTVPATTLHQVVIVS